MKINSYHDMTFLNTISNFLGGSSPPDGRSASSCARRSLCRSAPTPSSDSPPTRSSPAASPTSAAGRYVDEMEIGYFDIRCLNLRSVPDIYLLYCPNKGGQRLRVYLDRRVRCITRLKFSRNALKIHHQLYFRHNFQSVKFDLSTAFRFAAWRSSRWCPPRWVDGSSRARWTSTGS